MGAVLIGGVNLLQSLSATGGCFLISLIHGFGRRAKNGLCISALVVACPSRGNLVVQREMETEAFLSLSCYRP